MVPLVLLAPLTCLSGRSTDAPDGARDTNRTPDEQELASVVGVGIT